MIYACLPPNLFILFSLPVIYAAPCDTLSSVPFTHPLPPSYPLRMMCLSKVSLFGYATAAAEHRLCQIYVLEILLLNCHPVLRLLLMAFLAASQVECVCELNEKSPAQRGSVADCVVQR